MKKKAKIITAIIAVVVVLLAAALLIFWKLVGKGASGGGRLVYVESVKSITGLSLGLENRYMGIVESQETKSVEKDPNKTVKEVYVQEGDMVSEGDPLFIYDTEDMELQLQQLKLELQSIENGIATTKDQIKDLTAQRDQASADDKLGFTSQIQNLQATIKEEEYNLSVKQLEIERQEQSIQSAAVTAPMSGVIKQINPDAGNSDYNMGSGNDANAYITIMAVGDYRVKGTVSELNVYDLTAGMPVIMRSRVDESITWHGTIESIDMEPQQNNNDYYYGGGGGESTSKYSFYVTLDSTENLILGQHLYIEMDYGQGEVKEGLWIPSYYIMTENGEYYVWARDEKEKIEKRKVSIGEYDENTDCYEILDGLAEDDYIAFPEEDVVEGSDTTTNYDDIIDQMGDDGMMDDGMMDDGMMDDGMMDDGMMDDGMMDDGMMDDGMMDDGMMDDGMINDDMVLDDDMMVDDGGDSDASDGGE